VTPQQWQSQGDAQDWHCAICGTDYPGKWDWHADHVHDATRFFRGILCNKCNKALGMMDDDADRLECAAVYLRAAQA